MQKTVATIINALIATLLMRNGLTDNYYHYVKHGDIPASFPCLQTVEYQVLIEWVENAERCSGTKLLNAIVLCNLGSSGARATQQIFRS